jgi:hypothetical protein
LNHATGKTTNRLKETGKMSGNLMKSYKKSYKSHVRPKLPVPRPNVVTLLVRIAESAVTGGMRWLVFFSGLLIVFLHFNHFPADSLLVPLIFTVVIIAIFRGIRSWQGDLEEYQRNLTEYRMNMADNRNKNQVKKDLIWNRR